MFSKKNFFIEIPFPPAMISASMEQPAFCVWVCGLTFKEKGRRDLLSFGAFALKHIQLWVNQPHSYFSPIFAGGRHCIAAKPYMWLHVILDGMQKGGLYCNLCRIKVANVNHVK